MFVVWSSRTHKKQDVEAESQSIVQQKPSWTHAIQRMMKFLVSTSFWTFVFCILYLVYAILFGLALGRWNVDRFGYCYRYKGIASPTSSHPTVDQIYLGITCLYMFSLLGYSYTESYAYTTLLYKLPALGLAELTKMAGLGEQYGALQDRFEPHIAFYRAQYGFVREILSGRYPLFLHNLAIIDRPPSSRERRLFSFLNSFDSLSSAMSLPLAQYLLHLYMVWAIRSANQVHLQGDFEDTWGFGQVVALVQIFSCLRGFVENCISKALLKNSHMY